MIGRLQLPQYTAAALTAANPVLLDGEVVYESDTRRHKIGDGVKAWNALPYAGGGDFEGNIPGDSDSPISGYKNILPAPKNEYFFTDFLGRQEITITFKNPISPADFSGNYMFIDAEIFENGAYTLASLPLTIARVNSIDDPIRLTECCLWSVKSISADYAYVSISLSNFTMQNGKYTGCRMTVVSDGMADASAYELHWRGLYLRAR